MGCGASTLRPPRTTPRPRCNEDLEFTCDNGMCIPRNLTCDHVSDCVSGDDEKNCSMCHYDTVVPCLMYIFNCLCH